MWNSFRRRFVTALALVGFTAAAINPVQAQDFAIDNPSVAPADAVEGQVVLPRFVAGDTVVIDEPHAGAVFAAGSSVNVNAEVGGDLVVAGASVTVNAPVRQDIYAAGATVIIDAPVDGNIILVGAEVQFQDGAQVAGSVITAGQSLQFLGDIRGQLIAAGEKSFLAGMVGRDGFITAQTLEMTPAASIGGDLKAQVKNNLVSDQASVAGTVEVREDLGEADRWQAKAQAFEPMAKVAGAVYSFVWKSLLLAALLYFIPTLLPAGTKLLEKQGALTVISGMVALVGIPVGALFLMMTIVGVPIAFLALGLYVWFLFVGWIFPTMWVGQKLIPDQSSYLQAMLGVALVVGVGLLPILGALVKLVLATVGLGVGVMMIRDKLK